jgi:hypothetical protein
MRDADLIDKLLKADFSGDSEVTLLIYCRSSLCTTIFASQTGVSRERSERDGSLDSS